MINMTSLSGLEIKLIEFFLANITEKFGLRELSRKMGIDYKLIYVAVQKLIKKNVLITEKKANLSLCSLNLKGELTYIQFVEMIRRDKFFQKHKDFEVFFQNVFDKIKYIHFTLIIFGSFVNGKENKESDLDLLILAPKREISEEIQRLINSESVLLKRKIHSITLNEEEFMSNLSDKKLNVVVEAFKNHILITGIESFYNGVKKEI